MFKWALGFVAMIVLSAFLGYVLGTVAVFITIPMGLVYGWLLGGWLINRSY